MAEPSLVQTMVDVLRDVKALWDAQGFGDDEAVSEPLYARLVGALEDTDEHLAAAAFEVEAACGHMISPERDDAPPCEGCERCERCCWCGRCPRCGRRWFAGCMCPVGPAGEEV